MQGRCAAIGLTLLMAACGGGTSGPDAKGPWYAGQWTAVRANGVPLPYQYTTSALYETRAIDITLFDYAPSGNYSDQTYRYSTALGDWVPAGDSRFVDVVAGGDSVNIRAEASAGSGRLYITFRRLGSSDTLYFTGNAGIQWKFARKVK